MLDTLDAAAVRRWCGSGLAALRAHQHEIDELNVYPVPDGDTGTNLVLTLASAQQALTQEQSATTDPDGATRHPGGASWRPDGTAYPGGTWQPGGTRQSGDSGQADGGSWQADGGSWQADGGSGDWDGPGGRVDGSDGPTGVRTPLGDALRLMARGALLGARGNSGVIVSQILRGMADALASTTSVRGGELARALRSATEAAYAAVTRPVEGTVLSVVAAAADAAARIGSDNLVVVARAAATAAAEALARTPQQLPVLARAGVVDAGGRGLCLLLDALVDVLGGRTPDERSALDGGRSTGGERAGDQGAGGQGAGGQGAGGQGAGGQGAGGQGAGGQSTGGQGGDGEAGQAAAGEDPIDGDHGGAIGDIGAGPAQGRHAQVDTAPESGYEVQYLLDAPPDAMPGLRLALAAIGDSLVVVGTGEGDPPTWNVHVHVGAADIGAAIEAGVVTGRPYRIAVTPLTDRRDHHTGRTSADGRTAKEGWSEAESRATENGAAAEGRRDRIPQARARPVDAPTVDVRARGAVVVAAGDGLMALFTAEGATVVGHNPSTAEVLAAIRSTRAGRVVLLPNDANTQAVAVSAAREATGLGIRVSVVPTRSPVQALAALAVRDPQRAFSDDVIAMAEAAGACRYGEVCTARREALTVAGQCRPGDLLGLVDGEVHVIGTDLAEVCRRLLDRMLGGGGELTTLVLGADAPAALEETLRGHVARTWPFVELQCYAGGQPRYHLLVGVE